MERPGAALNGTGVLLTAALGSMLRTEALLTKFILLQKRRQSALAAMPP